MKKIIFLDRIKDMSDDAEIVVMWPKSKDGKKILSSVNLLKENLIIIMPE